MNKIGNGADFGKLHPKEIKLMKKLVLIASVFVAMSGFALAGSKRQTPSQYPISRTVSHTKKKQATSKPFVAVSSTSFVDELQLKQTALKFQGNRRATYSVILSSAKRHLAPQATLIYGDLLRQHPGDAGLQSAYAFSHFMAVGPLSDNYFTAKASPLVTRLRREQLKADYYRRESQKAALYSPEIKLECAIATFYLALTQEADDVKIRQIAVDDLHDVVKNSPDWADAHYWLGRIIGNHIVDFFSVEGKNDPRIVSSSQEALKELNTAIQLKPQLRASSLISYVYIYQWLGQPVETLKYLNLYLQANPKKSKESSFQKWRQDLMEETQGHNSVRT